MALSNSQYDELMRTYEQRQLDNEHALRKRYETACSMIPKLPALDDAISSISIKQARLLLDGHEDALSELKEEISRLSCTETRLFFVLTDFRKIIWNSTISARTAKTRVTLVRINATASKKRSWIYYIHSQTCRKFWKRKTSLRFLLIIIPATTKTRLPAVLRWKLYRLPCTSVMNL